MSHLRVNATKGETDRIRNGGPQQRIAPPFAGQKQQRHLAHKSNTQDNTKNANKRRRQEEAAISQVSNFSFLSTAKKSKPSDPSSIDVIVKYSTGTEQNPTNSETPAVEDASGVGCGMASG